VKPAFAHLLDEFVDREAELARFLEMLSAEGPGIMVVWGDGGVGKSTLLSRITHEIAQRDGQKSEVVWTETRNHDYLAVMRKIRDDVGVEWFVPFTDLVNYFTVPQYKLNVSVEGGAKISVGQGMDITRSQTGDIAGVLIKDVMLTEARADMHISQTERVSRLTDSFLKCLASAVANEPLVVLFDAFEKMSEETETWVWQELLTAVRDGRLGNIKLVLCGRKEPELDRSWTFVANIAQLRPLTREHLVKYLEKRGVAESGREQLAEMLLIVTHGNMLELATHVDAYLKLEK